MATIKSYTDIEQSKKLAEILPLESADMWYWEFPTAPSYNSYGYPMFHKGEDIHNVPCWSLAALLDVINNNYYTTLYHDGVAWNSKIIHHDNVKDKHGVYAGTPIDACYELILKLHKLKML